MKTLRLFVIAAMAALWLLSGTASAQAIDDAFRADLEALLEASGGAAMGTQVAAMVSNQTIDNMRRSEPQIPDGAIALTKDVLNAEFKKAFDPGGGMRRDLAAVYAKYFTHAEVKTMLEFFRSEAGRKSVATQAQLSQDAAAVGQAWAAANVPRILDVLQARLRAEGYIK